MEFHKGGLIQPYAGYFGPLFRVIDILIIGGNFWLASYLLFIPWQDAFTIAALVGIVSFMIAAEVTGLYGSWRFSSIREELQQLFITWLMVIFVLLILAYATKVSAVYSRRVLLSWMVLTPVVLSVFRIVLRQVLYYFREHYRNTKSAVIVGTGKHAEHLLQELHLIQQYGIRIPGFFDDQHEAGYKPLPDFDEVVLDKTENVVSFVNENNIDIVFITLSHSQDTQVKNIVDKLADTTAQVFVIPDMFISNLLNTRIGYIGDIPILAVHDRPFTSLDGMVKRFEDVILSVIILILVALPMLMIAILIKVSSPGSVIFKQKRYGLSGEPINVWKFRTMTVCEDGNEIKQAQRNDVRVTGIGAFLRRTSLDELPQFINVLQGRMSIVGPRPHAVAHNEQYRKEIFGYMLRHTIKPGITGWAQVNGWRGETETLDKMENRIKHDLWYIKNWSFLLDIKIILLTIIHGFSNKNSY